jgi:hypothetical protein
VRRTRGLSIALVVFASVFPAAGVIQAAKAEPALPAIRIAAGNVVPSCVTPARLMSFLTERNTRLEPKFQSIASEYKRHGEAWRVRWDYAFFQMVLETNYLTFRRGDGSRADVDPRQNNFAGIGTTGGGVPGDSFPDVATGVLAQIQHLVVYSGERVPHPTAPRTRAAQEDILSWTEPLSRKRPVTFRDLAGRWASDRAYARSITATAERFRSTYCNDPLVADAAPPPAVPAPQPWQPRTVRAAAVPEAPHLAPRPRPVSRTQVAAAAAPAPAPATTCRVQMASYGGRKALLIRYEQKGVVEYTALRVLDGFERSMADSFLRTHAPDGALLGEFPTSQEALARAYELCPSGTRSEKSPKS